MIPQWKSFTLPLVTVTVTVTLSSLRPFLQQIHSARKIRGAVCSRPELTLSCLGVLPCPVCCVTTCRYFASVASSSSPSPFPAYHFGEKLSACRKTGENCNVHFLGNEFRAVIPRWDKSVHHINRVVTIIAQHLQHSQHTHTRHLHFTYSCDRSPFSISAELTSLYILHYTFHQDLLPDVRKYGIAC